MDWAQAGVVIGAVGLMLGISQRLSTAAFGRVRAEMEAMEARLTARIDGVEARLGARIDVLAERMDGLALRVGRLEEGTRLIRTDRA